jgi:hypothetical protein
MLGFLVTIAFLLSSVALVTTFAMASASPRPLRFSLKGFMIVLTLVALVAGLFAALAQRT